MKNIRLLGGTVAITIFIMLNFAFTTNIDANKFTLANFYVNPDGTRGAQVIGLDECRDDTSQLCSQEYDTKTGLPTGNSGKLHFGSRP